MRQGARILYLLRSGESRPPESLIRASGSIHLLRAGTGPDGPTREYGPQLIAFRGPYDFDARAAIEAVSSLELPVLCFGESRSEALAAHVSEHISVEDLRTVLDLLVSISNSFQLSATECRAEDMGQCRGRVIEDLIRLLEHLLALRIPEYPERSERIFEASLWIGNHLCLPPHELKDLLRAARLREIGKLGLPDKLLFTPLHERTPDEQQSYDRYPILGARVIGELPAFRNVAHMIENQLENFDGSGPAGLMAHQIPLGSRVLRVASAFSTILHSKDKARSAADVISILDKGRGSLYDPLLVKLVENFHKVENNEAYKKNTRWVRIADLGEGMVLAEDMWSRTGMKIIPSGTRLTKHILRILAQFPIDPSLEAVQVVA
ncbi:hypothetical protein EHM69_12925 [candidate division KSB1 bacterium]|nr:MAG: hypothetical protein EHM69_12925 [candidate division KSB1 bacterium]